MEDTKKSLLSIDIDTASLTANIVDAKNKVSDFTKQLKDLKAAGQENSVEAVNLAAALKNAKTEVSQGTSTLANYNKALDATTGYLERQKLELGLTQQQFNKLTEEQLKSADVGGKMQASADKLSKSVTGLDKSVGNTKSSIGDYENSIVSALGKTGLFGDVFTKATDTVNSFKNGFNAAKDVVSNVSDSIDKVCKSAGIFTNTSAVASSGLIKFTSESEKAAEGLIKVETASIETSEAVKLMGVNGGIASKGIDLVNTSTEETTGLMQLLKIALASTGIGLLIVALGTLYAYFQSTNEGAKKFQQITNAIGAVLQGVMKILAPIGKAIWDVFTEPQGAVKLMTALFSLAILPIKTLATTLWDLGHGNFKQAFKDVGDGVVEFAQKSREAGEAAVHMFKDTVKASGEAADAIKKVDFKKTVNDSLEATKARQALTKAEREWSEQKIKQQGEVELLTKKLRDQGISESERMKLAEQAKTIREKIFQGDLDIAKKNEVLVEKEQALNGKKDFQAITDAKNRVQEVINAKDSEIQGIQNRESRVIKAGETRAEKEKKLLSEAESERLSSIARTSQAIYDKYGEEISKTEDKYRKLAEKYKNYADTVKQLEVERQSELKKITDQFQKDAEANLVIYNKELADIRSKDSDDELQKQLDVIDQQTADKLKKLDVETAAIDLKISQQVKAANDLRAQGDNQAADLLQKSIDIEIKTLATAGQLREAIIKQQIEDEARIKKEAADKKSNTHLEGDIINDSINGEAIKEFNDRQKLLDQEHDQAVAAAYKKGEDTYKIDAEYKQKSIELTKAKNKAEEDNNKLYLSATVSLAGGLMAILGKNTEAYKVAFRAHQAAQAGMTIIDTYRAVMGIWASDSAIPFVGVPKAIAETAIAVGAGAASLAQIWSAKPGYSTGGYHLSDGRGSLVKGPGSGTSDSINARISNGEAIINARSTSMFGGLLSKINELGGGRAFNVPAAGGAYADGGVLGTIINTTLSGTDELSQTRNARTQAEIIGANMPKQILVVEDVQAALQNKASLQSMSNF
jgi:hypothetical protein